VGYLETFLSFNCVALVAIMPRPCINSVNINVEFCGGVKIFVLLLAKPSNLVSSSPCIASLLIIVYQTLYLENSVEVANPEFNKGIVRAHF
jgi:hypothetical protein